MAVRKRPAAQEQIGADTAPPTDLSVEEYNHCRELLLENVRAMDRNEVYTLGAVGATVVFSLAATNAVVAAASAAIPLALSIVARLRYRSIGIMTRVLNSYVAQLEKANPSIGWTTFHRKRKAGVSLRENRVMLWQWLMWGSAAFLVFRLLSVSYDLWWPGIRALVKS